MNVTATNPTLAETLWSGFAGSNLQKAALVLAGTALLALSAHIKVPFWPVPMTMQTFVVLMIGAAFGARLAGVTVLAYLIEGALGLPVFATGAGFHYMAGPTGGYLAGFLAAALIVGWFADRGHGRSLATSMVAFLVGEAVILALGTGWLAYHIGLDKAIAGGLLPFLFGEGVKVALACALLPTMWRIARR
ncbi:MAG: biotin transporter BioY [Rhodospirillaceae bacterium]|nr:biotin transporter BioY [Rhodospirillaceae bacterium]